VRRRLLLNLLVVSPKGEMFLKAVDTGVRQRTLFTLLDS
jgi:hypothetical protein